MDQLRFELSEGAQRRLDAHLDAVERRLMDSGVSREQRRSIVDDVEAQALEMLRSRSSSPSLSDLDAVLSSLDPPEAFAGEGPERHPPSEVKTPSDGRKTHSDIKPAAPPPQAANTPRLNRLALIGAGLPLVGMLVLGGPFFFLFPGSGLHLSLQENVIPLMPFLFASCVLGWIAIGQIRRSGGREQGLGLAVFGALLLPLLVLDLLILRLPFFSWRFFSLGFGYVFFQFVQLALVAVCIYVDILIVRWVWPHVNRPLSESAVKIPAGASS